LAQIQKTREANSLAGFSALLGLKIMIQIEGLVKREGDILFHNDGDGYVDRKPGALIEIGDEVILMHKNSGQIRAKIAAIRGAGEYVATVILAAPFTGFVSIGQDVEVHEDFVSIVSIAI
jgi:hypothetical protein